MNINDSKLTGFIHRSSKKRNWSKIGEWCLLNIWSYRWLPLWKNDHWNLKIVICWPSVQFTRVISMWKFWKVLSILGNHKTRQRNQHYYLHCTMYVNHRSTISTRPGIAQLIKSGVWDERRTKLAEMGAQGLCSGNKFWDHAP